MNLLERKTLPAFVDCVSDPYESFRRLVLSFPAAHNAQFVLFNASTSASEHEGISAAGVSAASRRLTPALDAEALILGRTISAAKLPISPKGIVSPVVISRACLQLLAMRKTLVECGVFSAAQVPALRISEQVAACPSTGAAFSLEHVQNLFEQGLLLGEKLAAENSHLVLAECVPGGTTTAFAVLTALGFSVNGCLSSSLPSCNHLARFALVQEGLSKSVWSAGEMRDNPLLALAAVGDAMQAVVAGVAIAACQKVPVFLAGGSQMLTIWAIVRELAQKRSQPSRLENIMVLSTKWVSDDPSASVRELAKMLAAPFAVASPNFLKSRHAGLRAYEDFNVKEGVGAGASMALCHAAGNSAESIMQAIDACYDELHATNSEPTLSQLMA